MKKITWVRRMYSQWREYRNGLDNGEMILCDLDDTETITEENLVFGMSCFVTEVRKVNGEQFPAKSLYEIVMCAQFHLESVGFQWKLLNDMRFVDLKFTLDNVMKERCKDNVGGGGGGGLLERLKCCQKWTLIYCGKMGILAIQILTSY